MASVYLCEDIKHKRKLHEGPNVPFGSGDTPIIEVLRMIRDERWPILATVEFEYPVPPDSDRVSVTGAFRGAASVAAMSDSACSRRGDSFHFWNDGTRDRPPCVEKWSSLRAPDDTGR